jgi:hypothetical protein
VSKVYVRVVLPDEDVSLATVGLIETLGAAGLILVRANDLDGGAVLDLPAADWVEAERLRQNLEAWHVSATVVRTVRS